MAQDRLPAREPDVASSRHQVPGAADPGQRAGDPHAGTGPSARGRHDIVEAEHTSFFWPEVDDLLTYEFTADLMDQLHAGLQAPPAADAPPPPAPSFPPAAAGPPPAAPDGPTMPAPSGVQPPPLSGPNPFLPGPADQPTVVAPEPGGAAPAAVPPVPDLKLSSAVPADADPTIRTAEPLAGAAALAPPDGPAPGSGYVPDVVAGSFGAEMAPPPPGPGDGSGGLDGLRGSRLFDPRPEPPDPGVGRLKVGNLFEPTDPGGPPQTRRLVRLAGRQSPDEVDVTSARLVSPFDSSGPSVRSLFPASRDGGRPVFDDDDGFGPGAPTSELRMGSPAPFGPDVVGRGPLLDGGPPGPPVSLSHSTVVDPASGPPVGASFLAPAPSDAWNSSNPAWTSVSDTVADLPPRQGQGFLYLEEDANSWGGGPQLMRQAEPVTRDKGAMLDSVIDVLDRKRGALLAGALALTVVLGGFLAYGKLSDGDGTDATGVLNAGTSATTASSVSSGTGESGSGAGVSIAGPTTVPGTQTTEAPSSAVTEASSTSSTRKRATTSSNTTATTAAPTDPTTATTQPPSSATTQPPSSPSTTRPTTTTTRATTTTRPPTTTTRPTTTTTASTTTTTASTTTTTEPTTTSSSTTSTTSATSASEIATP